MKLLIKNIKSLLQVEDEPSKWRAGASMAVLPFLEEAWLLISDGIIEDFGPMDEMKGMATKSTIVKEIDADGKMVLPAWCDSHTHLVFPETREVEYVDKIKGLSYEEIARREEAF